MHNWSNPKLSTSAWLGVALALPLVACGSQRPRYERNPSLPAQAAAGPTLAFTPIYCGAVGRQVGPQIETLYADRVQGGTQSTSSSIEDMLCDYVKHGSASSTFQVNPSLSVLVKQVAATVKAHSLFFLVVKQDSLCRNQREVVSDQSGETIANVDTGEQSCESSPFVDLKGLVFSEGGDFVWRGSVRGDERKSGAVDHALLEMLGQLPSQLVGTSPASAPPADAPSSPPQ